MAASDAIKIIDAFTAQPYAGVLPVRLRRTAEGLLVTMTQATPEFLAEIPRP